MSKVVIFNGSPRKNGYTSKLLAQVANGAKSKGAEVIEFNLNDPGIRGCQGCLYCRLHDGCAVNDYLQPMYEAIEDADAIVFGSPIYGYQISGQAKIWLDRTFPMVGDGFAARHPGKKAITIFAQGSPNPEIAAEGIKTVSNIFARYGWKVEDSILCCGTTNFHSEKFEMYNSGLQKFEELSVRAFKDGISLVK
ncbi:iron-sulfur flavoprotein [Desulfosporosinus acididurans]|uniref:Iron-sulfur flavoprotein n=1 Tax=Desulfosporosinus acididurans TaxID=476652 RepID=A0A0J1FND0_9FIRM|nr:flavodoxin family protein [Desulfosporosinus acididurans]KLU64463.1 iron-sulfur flavoprotein [Desulfosporosinus acididurans]